MSITTITAIPCDELGTSYAPTDTNISQEEWVRLQRDLNSTPEHTRINLKDFLLSNGFSNTLKGIDLENLNLKNIDFSRCAFIECKFPRSFLYCELKQVKFLRCDLASEMSEEYYSVSSTVEILVSNVFSHEAQLEDVQFTNFGNRG